MKTILCRVPIALLLVITSSAACADAAQLRAGAARIEFTQLAAHADLPPSGKYEHEKLYLRAIVLDNGVTRAALVSVDGTAPATIPEKVAAELKCPIENVLSSGTHSHSANLAGSRQQQDTSSPLADLAVQAVREAVAKMQPARMSFGTGLSYLNVNRDAINPITGLWTQDANLSGPSDKTVAVLKFETLQGQLIALYSNYAMHPVNTWLSGIVSADWPGAACRYIEQIYGDKAVAMLSQGADGDQNPLYLRASTAQMLRRGGAEYHGQPLVREEVESRLRDAQTKPAQVDAKRTEELEEFVQAEGILYAEEVLRVAQALPPGESDVRIAGFQQTITCPGRIRTDKGREGQPGTYIDGPDVHWLVRAVGIGDVALVGIDSGVYSVIAQELKAKSPMRKAIFVGEADGNSAAYYVPSDDAYSRNTFEVLETKAKSGCAQVALVKAGIDMLTTYSDGGFAGK